MSKRVWLLIAALSIVLIVAVVILALPDEPSYQGRRLTSWLEDLSGTPLVWNFTAYGPGVTRVFPPVSFRSPSAQLASDSKASEAVRHIGTKALPRLVQLIRREDSALGKKLLELLKKQSIIKMKIYSADERRGQGFQALAVLGRDAEPAWKEVLLDEHLSSNIRESALRSVGYSSAESAVSPLICCLSVTNLIIRTNAIKLLSRFDHKARASVPALLTAIDKENDPAVRALLATALRQCEPDIVLGSIRSLKYDPPTFRAGAAASLGMFKQHAEISVPALIRSIDDPEPYVREAAVAALGDFGIDARCATGAVLKACCDPKKYVRMAATNAVHQIDPH